MSAATGETFERKIADFFTMNDLLIKKASPGMRSRPATIEHNKRPTYGLLSLKNIFGAAEMMFV